MPRSRSRVGAPRAPPDGYAATLTRLFQRRRFGMRPGLETIRALLAALDHPERSFQAVHVAGSKGKGSISAITASVLQAVAPPVGLYTSPHLQSYRERILVAARPVDAAGIVDGLAAVEAAERALSDGGTALPPPTFFEVTTALAFRVFATAGVRHAAVEVGLGGEFDATNVLRSPVGVISTIELEHADILGPTLGHIARAKAGILHPGMRAITGETKPEPLAEIARVADRWGVPLWRYDREVTVADREIEEGGQRLTVETPHRRYEKIELPLSGTFQARNLAVAIAALELYSEATGLSISETKLRRGLRAVRWRGRLERVARRPDLYVDVAHTPESARALAASLAEIAPFQDADGNVVLFGCLEGKDVVGMLEPLSTLARTVVLVPVPSDRSAKPAEVRLGALGRFPRIVMAPSVAEGLRLARAATEPEAFTVAAGSDYLVGEVLNLLEGRVEGEPDLSDPTHPAPSLPEAGR